jgi:hypothetical protein
VLTRASAQLSLSEDVVRAIKEGCAAAPDTLFRDAVAAVTNSLRAGPFARFLLSPALARALDELAAEAAAAAAARMAHSRSRRQRRGASLPLQRRASMPAVSARGRALAARAPP